jgi:hypothetical protein
MVPSLSVLINGITANRFLAQVQVDVSQMTFWEMFGIWVAAFLTICIFSFLYEDNPFYKFAEHLFVGVSAGYFMATTFQNVIKPNLWGRLVTGYDLWVNYGIFSAVDWSFLIAGLMGVTLLMRLVPKFNWVARWPLSFMVGISSGLGVVITMEAAVIRQVNATLVQLIIRNVNNQILWGPSIQNWLIVLGVCSGLIYFYFSKEHKGFIFGNASRFGIYTLMIAFGAAFGYTVMARVSLLIGRMLFFQDQWWPVFKATFGLG